MSWLRAAGPYAAAASFLVIAGAIAALEASPMPAVALVFAALGCAIGGFSATVGQARGVARLVRASERAGAPGGAALDPRSFGILAPAARALDSMRDALHAAHEDATTDRLTRVPNRPMLLSHLLQEAERAVRYERPLAVAFIDLDHFKTVNDTYGHAVGDDVLRGVAQVFSDNLRATDFLGRYGGEEFMLVLPETGPEEAAAVAEKLRMLVLKQTFALEGGAELRVSVSIGIAAGQGTHLRIEELIRDADAAMYSAKSLGRNQTFVFEEPSDDARIPRAPLSADGRERADAIGESARRAAEATLAALVAPLPHYGGKPSALIATIAVALGRQLGLPERELERIRVASLLHDIGKVGVPSQIIEKPGPLSADEWQAIAQHPRMGQMIIDRVAAVREAGTIILHHHERYSGHGYPHGLRGNEIPLGARIVAIADAYDAMVNDRPYRRAVSHAEAISELQRHAGIQFDPELVAAFCDVFATTPPMADPGLLITGPTHLVEPVRRRRRAAASA